jgi:O-antigen/teichoic acid export membrane protein
MTTYQLKPIVIRRSVALVGVAGLIDGGGLMVALVAAARVLGPAGYGRFVTGYALVMLCFMVAEGGLTGALTRHVARDRESGSRYLGDVVALRLALSVLTWIASVALARIAFDGVDAGTVAVLGVYAALGAVSQLGLGVLRGHERMDLALFVVAVERTVLVGSLGLLAVTGTSGHGVAAAFVLSAAVRLGMTFGPVRRLGGSLVLRIDAPAWGRLLREALPYSVMGAMASVSWRIDTLMLSLLLPSAAAVVGAYNAAYTVFSAATLGAAAIAVATFPAVARLHTVSPAAARHLCRRAVAWLLSSGTLAAVVLYAAAPSLIASIYGDQFLASVPVLRILAWAVAASYVGIFIRVMLPAIDRAWHAGAAVGLALLAYVGLNLLLIPRFGARGAAWATVISEVFGAALGAVVLGRYLIGRDGAGRAADAGPSVPDDRIVSATDRP